MKLKIEDIIVDERIRQTVGNIEELALDLRVNGQIVPITVRVANDGTYHLVAGYRRITAMRLNGEDTIEAFVIPEDDEETLLRMEISENEIRENFTRSERMKYIRRLDEIEAKKAKERQGTRTDIRENSHESYGRSDEAVAKQVGISSNTIAREKKIIEHKDEIDPEDFKNWDEGKLSTNKVFTALKAKLKAKEEEAKEATEGNAKLVKRTRELENDALKWRQAYENQELPQATIDEIAELKEQLKAYKHTEDVLRADNKRLAEDRTKWERLYKESGRVEPTLDEKAKKDMDWLTMGIFTFLQQYGSKGWAIDRRESIPQHQTEELRKQARNLLAFAQNLYEMTKGDKE